MPELTTTSTDHGALLQKLGATNGPKLAKAASAYAVAESLHGAGKGIVQRLRAEMTYTVSIDSDDEMYPGVHRRLLELLPPQRQRALVARTRRQTNGGEVVPSSPDERPTSTVSYYYDGTRDQTVDIAGHRIAVSVSKESGGSSASTRWSSETIKFSARSKGGRDAVLDLVSAVAAQQAGVDRPPAFRMAGRWGGWDDRQDLPKRSLDTVILPAGQREHLIGSIERFLADESAYERIGSPWHYGVLLHGPPGSGKTSIAKAVANHLGLDVYYVPLADLSSDASLLNLVASIRPRSLLLLEDIDVLDAATSREEGDGLTMSGLLNALDGVFTPHGIITVATTNHREVLDDAMIRPGRIDLDMEIGWATPDQIGGLYRLAFPRSQVDLSGLVAPVPPVSAAQVLGTLKPHLNGGSLHALHALMGVLNQPIPTT